MTQPLPAIAPAAPKKVIAPAAPVAVNLARTEAASVANSNPHPTAVALGQANNPISVSNRPATAVVNLGQHGLAGVPASNTGGGPVATAVNLGSGSAGSQTIAGNGTRPVQGVKLGIANGTGPLNSTSRSAGQVNLGQIQQVALPKPPAAGATSVAMNTPKVLWKPQTRVYAGATALHINWRSPGPHPRLPPRAPSPCSPSPVRSAMVSTSPPSAPPSPCASSLRSTPAAAPVDWEGNVTVTFQSESNG